MSEFNIQQLQIDSPVMKVKEIVPYIQEQILEGNIDAAKAGIILKKSAKLWEELFKGDLGETVKDVIYTSTLNYREGNKKTIELMGAKITAGAVRTWYTFEECNDPLWNELNRLEKKLSELRKKREEELKALIPPDNQLELGIQNKQILVPYEIKIGMKEKKSPVVASVTPPIKRSIDGLKYSV